jgi:hypothetical protein
VTDGAAPVVALAKCWRRYRQHLGSTTAQATRVGQVEAHSLGESELRAELARQRFRYRHPRLGGLARRIGGRYARAR